MKEILLSLLGLALFLFIVLSIGVEEILKSLFSINPCVFAVAFVLLAPSVALKGYKQQLLVSIFRQNTALIDNIKIWVISFFFGAASPAKSGEAARSLYLKRFFGLSLGEGLSVMFIERFLDIIFLFGFAFAGLFFLGSTAKLDETVFFSILLFCVAFFAVIALMLKKGVVRFLLRPFFGAFAPERFKAGLRQGFSDFYKAIHIYSRQPKKVFFVALATIASWLLAFVQFYIIAIALSINISFFSLLLVLPIILLVEALPVSFSGLGTRDAASIVMFGLVGISASAAVSFSLTLLLFNAFLAGIGFLLFNSVKKPI